MTFGKSKDGGKAKPGRLDDGIIDASPDSDGRKSPRTIQDTRAWKDSTGGIQRVWDNYVKSLGTAFGRMNRRDQVQLISRFSQIITVGVVAVTFGIFYPFLPSLVRVLALPAVIVGAWWVGTKLIAPEIVTRLEDKLSKY